MRVLNHLTCLAAILFACVVHARAPDASARVSSVQLAEPDGRAAPRDELQVSVESVGFRLRQDFAPIADKFRSSEFGPTEITPRFLVRPLVGRPILGAEARVRISRLTASDGADLLASGATLTPLASLSRQYSPRFVFFAADANNSGRAASYSGVLRPRAQAITLDHVPSAIGVLEGDLTIDVVEEDETREFTLAGAAKRVELSPGMLFSFEPGEPWAQASVSVDPAATRGREPILNFVRYSAQPGVVSLPNEMSVPFHPAPPEDAPIVARAKFSLLPGPGPTHVESHVVLKTRSVTLPFRVENLVLTGAPRTPGPRPPAPTDFQVTRDDYTLRLASLAAHGVRAPEGAPLESQTTAQRQPAVVLGLEIADAARCRAFGWFTACRVDAATNDSGATIYAEPAAPDASGGRAILDDSYFPCPELPAKQPPKTGRDDQRRLRAARFSVAVLPARFGTIRGVVQFAEVKREVVREIKLVPTPEPIELAPGIRVIVREPTPDPNVFPPQPRDDWVVVQIDLPAAADRRFDAPSPRLNMVQFIDAAGDAGQPIFNAPNVQSGSRRVHTLGQPAFQDKAASMRVQVVLETTPREIPFEFHDVPCTER